MPETHGLLELDRTVDSIRVGVRHRKDLGDLDDLVRSIDERGLLQPITVTPDGVLVCGLRRLEAIKRLGWRTTNVWVRRGITEGAHRLLAEQDENSLRKPFSDLEAEELYREIKALLAEGAARRQAAHQFGTRTEPDTWGASGSGESPEPATLVGDARAQAARMVTGNASYKRMEQIGTIRDVADDPTQPARVRHAASAALERIRDGHPVNPAYESVRAAMGAPPPPPAPGPSDEELQARAAAALERIVAARSGAQRKGRPPTVKAAPTTAFATSPRMWIMTFTDMDGWLDGYDAADLATSVTPPQWATFERVLEQMTAFAAAGRAARAAVAGAA